MRVLQILGSLHRGGAETMVMNYYRAFDKQLCQMDFVIHAEYENDYRAEAESLGAMVFLLDRPGKVGAIKYIKQLRETIKKNGPYQAVHIHTNHQAFLGVIAARLAGVKNIAVHSHSTGFDKRYIMVNRLFMTLCNVKRLACGEAAGRAFFGNRHYDVINNAIDAKRFIEADNESWKMQRKTLFGDSRVIGHLGRFSKPKNHQFIISMMEELVNEDPDIILALYGEGELEGEIRELVRRKGLDKNVLFMGVTDDVVTAYHLFDMFILPSLWEGFPVTLIEAQLSGVSCLASDSVSRECDLGIGKLQFLKLEERIWVRRIIEELNTPHEEISNPVCLEAYDVRVQWKKLYSVYCA